MANRPDGTPDYSLDSECEKLSKIFDILGEKFDAVRKLDISWDIDNPVIVLRVEKYPSMVRKDDYLINEDTDDQAAR